MNISPNTAKDLNGQVIFTKIHHTVSDKTVEIRVKAMTHRSNVTERHSKMWCICVYTPKPFLLLLQHHISLG
jgi:hypothetical protein